MIIISPGLHERAYVEVDNGHTNNQSNSYISGHGRHGIQQQILLHISFHFQNIIICTWNHSLRFTSTTAEEYAQRPKLNWSSCSELVMLLGSPILPGDELQNRSYKFFIVIRSSTCVINTLTHPKKTTIPCHRAVQNQRRNSLLFIIRFYKYCFKSKSKIIFGNREPGEFSCKRQGSSSTCSCSGFAQGGQRQRWGLTSR